MLPIVVSEGYDYYESLAIGIQFQELLYVVVQLKFAFQINIVAPPGNLDRRIYVSFDTYIQESMVF